MKTSTNAVAIIESDWEEVCSITNSRKRLSSAPCLAPKKAKIQGTPSPVAIIPVFPSLCTLETLRKTIRGQRVARCRGGLDGRVEDSSVCLGRIVSVASGGDCIDSDLYRVAYEDGKWEDIDAFHLFDSLLFYCTFFKELDCQENQKVADMLFQHSKRIRYFKYCLCEQQKAGIDIVRVVKQKKRGIFYGIVMDHNDKTKEWTAVFEDGDIALMSNSELIEAGKVYNRFKRGDPRPINQEFISAHRNFVPRTIQDDF